MNQQQLLQLRQDIIGSLLPLVVEGTGEPRERFEMLLTIIRAGSATSEIYQKAFELANQIEDTGSKSEALFGLLSEVELTLEASTPLEEGEGFPATANTFDNDAATNQSVVE